MCESLVFYRTFRLAQRTRFEAEYAKGVCQICDKIIVCLAAAVADDAINVILPRELHCIECFGERTDLIWFDDDGPNTFLCDRLLYARYVRRRKIIADDSRATRRLQPSNIIERVLFKRIFD